MIARHDEHIGIEIADARQQSVYLLDLFDLGLEVSILAAAVGVLEVHEEEVILRPMAAQSGDFLLESCPGIQHIHAHQLGHAPIHGVDGDGTGAQLEDIGEFGEAEVLGKAAQV